jgi:hypothetical protein
MPCTFPAEALIREMRKVCADADATHDLDSISKAARYVRDTNLLRHDHEELTSCGCWYVAVNKLRNARQKETA